MKLFTQRRIGSDRIPVTKTEMRFLRGGRRKGEGDSKELLKRVEDGKRREKVSISHLSVTQRLESSTIYMGCTRGFKFVADCWVPHRSCDRLQGSVSPSRPHYKQFQRSVTTRKCVFRPYHTTVRPRGSLSFKSSVAICYKSLYPLIVDIDIIELIYNL